MKITVIIPVRLSDPAPYDDTLRISRILDALPPELFDALIVDFGTPDTRRGELQRLADDSPLASLSRIGAPDEPFSIGRARDHGVLTARTDVVMMHDIDFLAEPQTYREIAAEAALRGLDRNAREFITIPTIYLSPQGTEDYLALREAGEAAGGPGGTGAADGRRADRSAHSWALREDGARVEHAALGSSALLINRHLYLASGGHDPAFAGHGAEDFEFYNRLTDLAPLAERPPKYEENIGFSEGRWEGFRSFFALYGMEVWMRGVALVHLDHPRRHIADKSYGRTQDNFKLCRSRMSDFRNRRRHRPPLGDPHLGARGLVLIDPTSRVMQSLQLALPLLGDYVALAPTCFRDPAHLLAYVREEGIDRVLFLNPYGNPFRLKLYNGLRAKGVRCIAFDRGALPDSWFFDDGGFLASSSRYDAEAWDIPLPPGAEEAALARVAGIVEANETLEANGGRQSGDYWRERLGVGPRKVIFVPLQRPMDTATRFFAGPCGSAEGFNAWIAALAERIDHSRWVIVAKKHPLESERAELPGVVYAPDAANIYDLIELSDKVVVINSGAGLLALGMNRPVIVCGDAFYAQTRKGRGLTETAKSAEALAALAVQDLAVDRIRVGRFFHYLFERFYSFGESSYFDRQEPDGASIRIVTRIDFRVLRQLAPTDRTLGGPLRMLSPRSFVMRGVQRFAPPPSPASAPPPNGAPGPAKSGPAKSPRGKPAPARPGSAALAPAPAPAPAMAGGKPSSRRPDRADPFSRVLRRFARPDLLP